MPNTVAVRAQKRNIGTGAMLDELGVELTGVRPPSPVVPALLDSVEVGVVKIHNTEVRCSAVGACTTACVDCPESPHQAVVDPRLIAASADELSTLVAEQFAPSGTDGRRILSAPRAQTGFNDSRATASSPFFVLVRILSVVDLCPRILQRAAMVAIRSSATRTTRRRALAALEAHAFGFRLLSQLRGLFTGGRHMSILSCPIIPNTPDSGVVIGRG